MAAPLPVVTVGVICPDCRSRASTVVLETGPVLVRHEHRWTDHAGARQTCRRQWVAVPKPSTQSVALIPVSGREEADSVLRQEATEWLQAFFDVYGFSPVTP